MSIQNVRQNPASFCVLYSHFEAYMAGRHISDRNSHMLKARELKRKNVFAVVGLVVSHARREHHEYLKCLRKIRKEQQTAERMQTYENTVLNRVMGVLHR